MLSAARVFTTAGEWLKTGWSSDLDGEALQVFQVKREKLRRGTGRAVLGTVCAVGCMYLGIDVAAAQGVPAASSVTSGQSAGQVGTPATQVAVPQAANEVAPTAAQTQPEPIVPPLKANLREYAGLKVVAIRYVGVDFDKSDRLVNELTQKTGDAFDPEKVRQTTRRLFATGRYRDIGVRTERSGDGVVLIFEGVARYYVGRVQVNGAQGRPARLAAGVRDRSSTPVHRVHQRAREHGRYRGRQAGARAELATMSPTSPSSQTRDRSQCGSAGRTSPIRSTTGPQARGRQGHAPRSAMPGHHR